jgi:signal transduction histidine kinase
MLGDQLGIVVLFAGAIAYIAILLVLVINRGIHEHLIRYLGAYILVSFVLDLFRTFLQYSHLNTSIQNAIIILSIIALVGLAALFLKICSLILPVRSDNRTWLFAGALWTLGLFFWVVLNSNHFLNLPSSNGSLRSPTLIFNIMAVFGWSCMMGRIVYLTFGSLRLVKRPLHKNRLGFWTISLLLIVFGDVLFFRNVVVVGSPLHLAGVSIIVYVLLTHNLIDIFRTSLQSLRYLIITFIAMLVYAILLLVLQPIIQSKPGYNAVLGAIVMAAVLAFLINPIVDQISRRINRSLLGMDYDPSTIMREYSQSVNNIVDLKLLEQISMHIIKNTFGVDDGHLYTVEEGVKDGRKIFQISDIGEDEAEGIIKFELHSDDPISRRFSEQKLPLTQYDLDYHPMYRRRAYSGSRRFLSQELDVFVPIHDDDRWIGLFALGPKTSGDRYYDEELLLLETLADQSAVALENARLFTRLQQINKELDLAQKELEIVNTRLLEMDHLKSAFISVITHEMRTPLANLAFALQIFEMYGRENFTAEQKSQLEELHNGMVSARRMVDDLVTYAAFLNDQADLKWEDVDMRDMVMNALNPHQAVARDRGVKLVMDVSGKDFALRGDSRLLTNAVYHLINNAIKYTQEGGTVLVSCWDTAEGPVINIKDTGMGISSERMDNIWEAFASVSNPLLRGWEGLGLGLALVKLIVEAHGGRVWAQSEPGKGSDFGFIVPHPVQDDKVASIETPVSEI